MESYHEDYDTTRLYDLVNLVGALAQAKTDKIHPWSELEKRLTGKVKVDNRTDEEIEKEIMEKYNKAFKVK